MPKTFEENLKQLDTIVQELEAGSQDLEGSLKSFEAGIKLSRTCHKDLAKAQKKVEILLQNNDGTQSEVPIETQMEIPLADD